MRKFLTRRTMLRSASAGAVTGAIGFLSPAVAQFLAPTKSMRGGSNNYRPDAPIVERIGGGGFLMRGTVRRAGDGAPLAGQCIQIWAHTTEGHERDERSHGATLTDENGVFRLEMPQIVPAFGQAHAHLAYDSDDFETVFLRPPDGTMSLPHHLVIWQVLILVIAVPIAQAATSPLLAWRDPIYILAGFSGIVAMVLLVVQPLLALGVLPGAVFGRRMHRVLGAGLVLCVVVHVGALWITSPPDVVDTLTFTSPTSFFAWGVIAMWSVFAAALLAVFRKRLGPRHWRLFHGVLTFVIALGTVIQAVLIEGRMEPVSKAVLAVLVLNASLWALYRMRIWMLLKPRK